MTLQVLFEVLLTWVGGNPFKSKFCSGLFPKCLICSMHNYEDLSLAKLSSFITTTKWPHDKKTTFLHRYEVTCNVTKNPPQSRFCPKLVHSVSCNCRRVWIRWRCSYTVHYLKLVIPRKVATEKGLRKLYSNDPLLFVRLSFLIAGICSLLLNSWRYVLPFCGVQVRSFFFSRISLESLTTRIQ